MQLLSGMLVDAASQPDVQRAGASGYDPDSVFAQAPAADQTRLADSGPSLTDAILPLVPAGDEPATAFGAVMYQSCRRILLACGRSVPVSVVKLARASVAGDTWQDLNLTPVTVARDIESLLDEATDLRAVESELQDVAAAVATRVFRRRGRSAVNRIGAIASAFEMLMVFCRDPGAHARVVPDSVVADALPAFREAVRLARGNEELCVRWIARCTKRMGRLGGDAASPEAWCQAVDAGLVETLFVAQAATPFKSTRASWCLAS